MMDDDSLRGIRVMKMNGDYVFEGEIVAVFKKRDGQSRRFVVEDDRGLLLIMNARQLGLPEKE
jgi:hypothetical protein